MHRSFCLSKFEFQNAGVTLKTKFAEGKINLHFAPFPSSLLSFEKKVHIYLFIVKRPAYPKLRLRFRV